jgi:hypothetical protein
MLRKKSYLLYVDKRSNILNEVQQQNDSLCLSNDVNNSEALSQSLFWYAASTIWVYVFFVVFDITIFTSLRILRTNTSISEISKRFNQELSENYTKNYAKEHELSTRKTARPNETVNRTEMGKIRGKTTLAGSRTTTTCARSGLFLHLSYNFIPSYFNLFFEWLW